MPATPPRMRSVPRYRSSTTCRTARTTTKISTASICRSITSRRPASTALQIINHLQDCKDDYENLDRVYLPLDHFAAAGVEVEALSAPAAGPALRRVLDATLDGVDALIAEAQPLAGAIRRPGMRREAAVSVAMKNRA